MAPLAGEIAAGGIYGIRQDGQTRFAELDDTFWNTKHLYQKYGAFRYKAHYKTAEDFISKLKSCCNVGLQSAHGIIIHALRDIQMDCFPLLEDSQIQELETQIDSTLTKIKKILMLNFMVARYLKVDKRPDNHKFEDIMSYILELKECIPDNYIDLNTENQLAFISSLQLPPELMIDENRVFDSTKIKFHCYAERISDRPLATTFSIYPDTSLITEIVSPAFPECIPNIEFIERSIRSALKSLTEISCLLNDILHNKLDSGKCGQYANNILVTNAFPIGFILEDNNNELLEPIKYEYGCKRSLTLGVDIKKIVTDDENIETVTKYLAEHGFDMQVISFKTLLEKTSQKDSNAVTPMQPSSHSIFSSNPIKNKDESKRTGLYS